MSSDGLCVLTFPPPIAALTLGHFLSSLQVRCFGLTQIRRSRRFKYSGTATCKSCMLPAEARCTLRLPAPFPALRHHSGLPFCVGTHRDLRTCWHTHVTTDFTLSERTTCRTSDVSTVAWHECASFERKRGELQTHRALTLQCLIEHDFTPLRRTTQSCLSTPRHLLENNLDYLLLQLHKLWQRPARSPQALKGLYTVHPTCTT